MDIFGNDSNATSKLVRIPSVWPLQLFVSSSYRLLYLLVSKSTLLSSIKHEISTHTGIDYGCIDIMNGVGMNFDGYHTIESVDWFYNKFKIFIVINPSMFCKPMQCGFGYLNKENLTNQSSRCDYMTLQYKQKYARNKGKMHIDLSIPSDLTLTLSST